MESNGGGGKDGLGGNNGGNDGGGGKDGGKDGGGMGSGLGGGLGDGGRGGYTKLEATTFTAVGPESVIAFVIPTNTTLSD